MKKLTVEDTMNLVGGVVALATLVADAKNKRDKKIQKKTNLINLDNDATIRHWGFSKKDEPVLTLTKSDTKVNAEIPFKYLREIEEAIHGGSFRTTVRATVVEMEKDIIGKKHIKSEMDDNACLSVVREGDVVIIAIRSDDRNYITATVEAWDLRQQIPAFKELVNSRLAKAMMNRF